MQSGRPINDTAIELTEFNANHERQHANIQTASRAAGVVGGLSMGTAFALFTDVAWRALLESTLRFILFPLAAAEGIFQAILAWRQAQLSGWAKGPLGYAIVSTIAAAAIATAVIGGFVATAAFTLAAPIIFVATLGLKAIYHGGQSLYHAREAYKAYKLEKAETNFVLKRTFREAKENHRDAAIGNAVGAVALALSAVATGMVMIAGKFIFGLMGVAAAGIGIGYTIISAARTAIKKNAEAAPATVDETTPCLSEDNTLTYTNVLRSSKEIAPEPAAPGVVNTTFASSSSFDPGMFAAPGNNGDAAQKKEADKRVTFTKVML